MFIRGTLERFSFFLFPNPFKKSINNIVTQFNHIEMIPEIFYNNWVTTLAKRIYAFFAWTDNELSWIIVTEPSDYFSYRAYRVTIFGNRYNHRLSIWTQLSRSEELSLRIKYREFLLAQFICFQFRWIKERALELVIDYVSAYAWRLKSYFYFARYIFESTTSTISSFFESKKLVNECRNQPPETTRRPPISPNSQELVFPREVWLEIAQHDVDILPLMFVNKALMDIFAPFIYNEVHCILVISSLEKMWASDEYFLRNGPDVPDSGIDGYGIYLRNKESRKYAYEVLDVTHDGRRYCGKPFEFRGETIKDEDKSEKKPSPSVCYSLDRRSTVVSKYSGLNCIISQIIKNPNSIMKKYLGKFSIDIMILSDIDKFNEDFDRAICEPKLGLKAFKVEYEDPDEMVSLFAGYDDYSDKRIGMRRQMRRDLGPPENPPSDPQELVRAECLKNKTVTVYHKELFAVSQVFESIFNPSFKIIDRGNFEFRNTLTKENQGFAFWKYSRYRKEFDFSRLVYWHPFFKETRRRTDSAVSSLKIKNRTFLCQDTFNEFCCLVKELSTTEHKECDTERNIIYSFLLHGVDYSKVKQSRGPSWHNEKCIYDYCCATPKSLTLSNISSNPSLF